MSQSESKTPTHEEDNWEVVLPAKKYNQLMNAQPNDDKENNYHILSLKEFEQLNAEKILSSRAELEEKQKINALQERGKQKEEISQASKTPKPSANKGRKVGLWHQSGSQPSRSSKETIRKTGQYSARTK